MPPSNAIFINVDSEGFSISPDGRSMVFTAQTLDGASSLWLRPVHSMAARPLPGTQGAIFTFWSPDSRSVAFCARDGILRRMDVGSPAPLPLAELGFYSDSAVPVSGSWNATGVILIGSGTGLRRVAATGGGVDTVTTIDPTRLRGRWRVSNTESGTVTWRRDGRELFYVTRPGGDIMAVPIQPAGASLDVGVPRLLFRARGNSLAFRSFDATRDGQTFIVSRRPQNDEQRFMTVVTNWQARLGP